MSQVDPGRSTDVNLGAYVAGLLRQRWLIAAFTIVGVLAGFLYSLVRVPAYESTATVEVSSFEGLDRTSLPGLMSTEKIVARSTAVAELARQELGSSDNTGTLLARLSVQGVGDAHILSFVYSSSDPAEARRGAQAFADAYVTFKEEQARQSYQQLEQVIQEQIDGLSSRIWVLSQEILSLPSSSARRGEARADRESLVGQIGELRTQLASFVPQQIDPAHVIEGANLPLVPDSPGLAVDLAAGGLFGLLVGVAVALIRNRRGERWRGAVDLEESLGGPVLGLIPKTPERREVITLHNPMSSAAEAYRKLRARVLVAGPRPGEMKTLLVTSASPGEGKSTIATNLAVTLAQAGKRTILVSADFRRPGVERLLKIRLAPGLSEVLSGKEPLGKALQPSGVPDLWVLASGNTTIDDIEILQSASIERFLHAGDLVDFIIIDAAPLLAVADALVLAPLVDGVVIVAHARRSRHGAVVRARQELEQVQARLLGIIVNEAPTAHGASYGAYPGYGGSRQKTTPTKATRSKTAGREPDLVTAGGAGGRRQAGAGTQDQADVSGQDWLQRRGSDF